MVAPKAERIALMAIRPEYSQAIMRGTKTVEFRRRPIAADVRTVLVYETSPTSRIVGEFTIGEVVVAAPPALWEKFQEVGGISEDAFMAYYAEADAGAAITITDAKAYVAAVSLTDLNDRLSVPQSFCYLNADVLTELPADRETVGARVS